MKVLLLGATKNLGSRLIPALQAHGHDVVVFVRSEAKLKQMVPFSILSRVAIATGDASDSHAVRKALVHSHCDALVDSAGQASRFPWEIPHMQDIIRAVTTAVVEAKGDGTTDQSMVLGWYDRVGLSGFSRERDWRDSTFLSSVGNRLQGLACS